MIGIDAEQTAGVAVLFPKSTLDLLPTGTDESRAPLQNACRAVVCSVNKRSKYVHKYFMRVLILLENCIGIILFLGGCHLIEHQVTFVDAADKYAGWTYPRILLLWADAPRSII